jgi:hypothetical protein
VKTLLPLLIILAPNFTFAQSRETYDLIVFSPPEGWTKETKTAVVAYTTTSPGTYCRIILYQSARGSGNSQEDFKNEWNDLVVKNYKPDQPAQQVQEQHAAEWNINAGTASFSFDNLPGLVMLTTMSDASTVISLVFVFNDESYLADIEKFMQSVEIIRPPQSLAQQVSQSVETPASNAPGLIGKWGRSSDASYDVANGTGGYSKSVYNFKSDGTYVFKQRTFGMRVPNIFIVKETGSYSISGNKITISPAKSTIESWTKKNNTDELGTMEKSQARKFETTTYRYTFHFFEGLGEWNLVLQADKDTERDGPSSSNTTFANAWYFDQKYLDQEMDAAKIH